MSSLRTELLAQGYVESLSNHPIKSRKVEILISKPGDIVAKVCGGCGSWCMLSDFPKSKTGLGGRDSKCKLCRSKNVKRWYEENKELCKERTKTWCEVHKERSTDYKRKWHQENKEVRNEKSRKYREENPEKVSAMKRKWYFENRDKTALSRQRRRARLKSLPYTFNEGEMENTLEYFKDGCVLTCSSDIHWDHVIPLASGHGGTIQENMIPLRADLNESKGDRNIFEWFEANRQRFNLSQERFDRLIEWLANKNEMTTQEYRKYVDWCHDNPRDVEKDGDGRSA